MADELIPSSTPNDGGDQKSAADDSGHKHDSEPKKEFSPTNSDRVEHAGLTKLEWGGFFVDLYVTLWIWSDLVGCHDIKRLMFLLAAILVAHGVLCYFFFKILKSWRWASAIWIVLG